MTGDNSSPTHTITIDRIVLEGFPADGLQQEQFRGQLAGEISSRLASSAALAGGDGSFRIDRVSARLEADEVADARAVARSVVDSIESSIRSD